jgi:hypothetical protein
MNQKKLKQTDRQKYKNREIYKYLCYWVTYTNKADAEIKARIIGILVCYHALGHLLI